MLKRELKETPLNYWEEKSYMIVIPKDENEDLITNNFDRIAKIKGVKVIESNYKIVGYFYSKSNIKKKTRMNTFGLNF